MLLAADINNNVFATGEDYDVQNFCSAWPNAVIWSFAGRMSASGKVPSSATQVRASGGTNPPSATPVYLIRKTVTCDATGLVTIAYSWPAEPFCSVTPWILTDTSRPPMFGIVSKTSTQTVIKLWKVSANLVGVVDPLLQVTAAGMKAEVELSL